MWCDPRTKAKIPFPWDDSVYLLLPFLALNKSKKLIYFPRI